MKNYIKTGSILVLSLLFAACGESNTADGEADIPDWKRDNTTTVCFISKLNDDPLIGTDSEEALVRSHIQSAKADAVILDRCDATFGIKTVNPLLFLAKDLKLIPVYAKNKLTTARSEGSGILLPHTIKKQEEIKITTDCHLKSVETVISASNKQKMVLSTTSIQTEEHISQSKSYLNAAIKQGHVIVGTIKSELYDSLKKQLQENTPSLRLEKVSQAQSSRLIFILTSNAWILRDLTTEINGALFCVNLQIEQL